MTIWVGEDGTLNDDEGDGPAAAWDPIVAWEEGAIQWGSIEAIEDAPYPPPAGFYVGQDWGAMLGQASGSMGSIGSGIGQALGGSTGKDVGGAVGDIFGSTIQGAESGGWQGALANFATSVVSKAVVPAIQSATKAPPPQAAPPATTPTAPAPTAPSAPPPATTTPARQAPPGRGAPRSGRPTADPKQRLLILLDHMAKTYGMPPAQTGGGRAARGSQQQGGAT